MSALVGVQLQPPFAEARRTFEGIVQYLHSTAAGAMTHSALERTLETQGRELLRALLQAHLDMRAPGRATGAVSDADGTDRPRIRLQARQLETVFGTVAIHRAGYGHEGTTSLHPLDAALNLPPERYSHELRRRVAEEAAKTSFDEVGMSIQRNTGGEVPKRQLEELVGRAAQDFDAFYQRRHAHPDAQDTGSVLVLSVDGKGVVMRTEDLRDATRKAATARTQKLTTRLSKGEKRNAKRMATVAAVYSIAPFVRQPEHLLHAKRSRLEATPRPRPESKRVWASLEQTPKQVIEDMFQEAASRDPPRHKTWVALVDGNKPQIRLLRQMARENHLDLTIIVDLIHVTEYLWAAGRAFHREGSPELERWVQHRILDILRGNAGHVAGGMRRSATRRGLAPPARKPVDVCARYLLTYAPYLKYHRALDQGLPIATGVIEGACRHLVKDRMDVTGARWSLAGAEAVLRLRALRSSQDFDDYWTFHETREYERNHQALYADGIVPTTTSPRISLRRPHLKVLK